MSVLAVIKIDKNIPPPKTHGKASRFPFDQMEVGDSFEIPKDDTPERLRSHASIFGRRMSAKMGTEVKFSVRKHEGVYRCWRIS